MVVDVLLIQVHGRRKPWGAKITIGKDIDGKNIYYFIDTFKTKLEALVCLENYHSNPTPLYVKEDKYNRIVTFPKNPYPLVPVKDPKKGIIERVKKDNLTFKQVFEKFEKVKLPTPEEIKLEKEKHIKPKGKYAYCYSRGMLMCYKYSQILWDKVYKDLRISDFQEAMDKSGKGYDIIRLMANLYKRLDEFALQEDIIDKGYAQHITMNDTRTTNKTKKTPFSYEQIEYLWNIKTDDSYEQFIRDFLLIALYTGARAEELLFIYTKNISLDENYFIGGLKTKARDKQKNSNSSQNKTYNSKIL